MYTVAVVDANPQTREELGRLLSGTGFSVALFTGWREARAELASSPPDAVLLTDWQRWGGRGAERYLRRVARGAPFVVVCDGGVTGWDDRFAAVLYHPVTAEHLAHAILAAIAREKAIVSAAGFMLDLRARSLARGERSVDLTPIEAAILAELMAARGEFVSSESLVERVWGERAGKDRRALYTHMAWLRGKLTKSFGEPDLVSSVRRRGYRFASERTPSPRGGRPYSGPAAPR